MGPSKLWVRFFVFFNDTATTEIYTLSLHDALPISHPAGRRRLQRRASRVPGGGDRGRALGRQGTDPRGRPRQGDRKSTRLNSSHSQISYAAVCLKKQTRPRRSRAVTPLRPAYTPRRAAPAGRDGPF